jgi:hypothetical protein
MKVKFGPRAVTLTATPKEMERIIRLASIEAKAESKMYPNGDPSSDAYGKLSDELKRIRTNFEEQETEYWRGRGW